MITPIESKILKACETGDLITVKNLMPVIISEFSRYTPNSFAKQLLKTASLHAHLDIVQFFLTYNICKDYMKQTENIKSVLEELLVCPNENILPIISYLANHPEPQVSYTFPSFVKDQIKNAIKNDDKPLFMALLNPNEPNQKNNHLHVFEDFFLVKDIYLISNTNIAKEFLTNPVFETWNDKFQAFKISCQQNNYEILKFLIFDLNLPKNENLSDFIKLYNFSEIEKMFDSRDLNNSLNQELNSITQISNKKIKL